MLQYFILRGAGLLCEKCLRWITFLRWPEILETIIKHLFNHQQKKIKASSLLFSFDTQKIISLSIQYDATKLIYQMIDVTSRDRC